jgi:hypothetical protein
MKSKFISLCPICQKAIDIGEDVAEIPLDNQGKLIAYIHDYCYDTWMKQKEEEKEANAEE